LATAKGLAFASGKPLATVSTLLAQAAAGGGWRRAEGLGQRAEGGEYDTIISVIKARQDEIYAARFRSAWPMPVAESEETLLPVAEFPQWLQTPAALCGNGVAVLQERGILEKLPNAVIIPEAAATLSGGLIARLGAIKLAAGEVADLANLEPRYLQAFETGPKKN
jgi:tRNA A37 threonylcarbamoyladenosine modification protein TsaB